jgi:hypothetical protein
MKQYVLIIIIKDYIKSIDNLFLYIKIAIDM